MPQSLDQHVARHLRAEARRITERWVGILADRLDVGPRASLPGDSILNHIPRVLEAVADSLEDPAGEPLDQRIREDLSRLADLRRGQGFSLAEILPEFAILADLVEDAVADAVEAYDATVDRPELVRLVGRVKDAIYLLGAETATRFRTWEARQQEERTRVLEAYTAMLSHELGNRLGAAETAARLIMRSGATLSEESSLRLHELILKSVKSGLETVQGVRSLFRPRGADGDDAVPTFPMGSLIRDAVNQLRIRAADQSIHLRILNAGQDDPVDAERFPLAFFNLVSNAIRHHDRPDGLGKVTIDVVDSPGGWTVTVADDGPGIPPELRDRVFEPLIRDLDGSGAGLGLAIAREAVEQMGGTIAFECGEPRGTTFRFTVPRVRGTLED